MTAPMFGIKEAADRTGLTARHLRQLVAEGTIPHRRIGRLIKFTEQDCTDIVAQFAVKPVGAGRIGRRAS